MTTLPVRRVAVVVASTRAAAGRADDLTGPVIRAWAEARGWDVAEPVVVADGPTPAVLGDRELMAAHRLELPFGFDPRLVGNLPA